MARGKGGAQAVLVQMPESSEPEIEPKTDDQRAADDQIAESTSQAPSIAQAKIERVDKRGRKLFLGTVAPDLVTNEFLAKECGGGEYIVEYRKPSKNGASTEYSQRRRFYIDEAIPAKVPSWFQDDDPVRVNGAIASSGGPGAPGRMDDIMSAGVLQIINGMAEASKTNAALTNVAIERLSKPSGPTLTEIAAVMSPIAQGIMALATALINRPLPPAPPPPPDPMAHVAAMAALMKQKDPADWIATLAPIFRPAPSDPSTMVGMLSAVEKVVSIGRELAPANSGEPAGPWDLAKAAVEALPATAAAFRNGQAVPAHVVANPPTNGTAPVANLPPTPVLPLPAPKGVSTEPVHSPDMMLQATLRPIAIELQQRCDANADADETADALFSRYAAFRGPMLSFTNEPGYQDKLLGLFPEQLTGQAPNGMSRAPWVRRVMTELAELLREPAE